MKKVLIGILALMMAFGLVGCGYSGDFDKAEDALKKGLYKDAYGEAKAFCNKNPQSESGKEILREASFGKIYEYCLENSESAYAFCDKAVFVTDDHRIYFESDGANCFICHYWIREGNENADANLYYQMGVFSDGTYDYVIDGLVLGEFESLFSMSELNNRPTYENLVPNILDDHNFYKFPEILTPIFNYMEEKIGVTPTDLGFDYSWESWE